MRGVVVDSWRLSLLAVLGAHACGDFHVCSCVGGAVLVAFTFHARLGAASLVQFSGGVCARSAPLKLCMFRAISIQYY